MKTRQRPSATVYSSPADEFISSDLEFAAAVPSDFSLVGNSLVGWNSLTLSTGSNSDVYGGKASVMAASLIQSSDFSNSSNDKIIPQRKRRLGSKREDSSKDDEVCCLRKALSVLLSSVQKKCIYFEDFELPGSDFGDKRVLSEFRSIVDSDDANELEEGKVLSVLCQPMLVASLDMNSDLSVDCLSSGTAEAHNIGRCFTESFEIDQRNNLTKEEEKTLKNSSSQIFNANDEVGQVNVTPFTRSFVVSAESQEQQIDRK